MLDYLSKHQSNKQIIKSIQYLPDQIRDILGQARLIKIPTEYKNVSRIVVNGMGGSNLGARIVKSVTVDKLKAPLDIVPGYEVPSYVDKNTLYILSSYSGTTEEPLSVYNKIKKRGAKILAITSGGEMEALMLKDNIPGIIFKPRFNTSGLPRLALGYSVFGIMVLLAKSGLFSIKIKEVKEIINQLEINDRRLRPRIKEKNNVAKQIALSFYKKIPVLVGAEFLTGNLHTWRNQLCETSKNFALYLTLPDLNHFALEGLLCPVSNKNNLAFFFLDSNFYHPRVQLRSELTRKVVEKHKIKSFVYQVKGETKLEQSFKILQLGSWVSYYLSVLNDVEADKTPFVDWFKKELTRTK